MLANVIPAFTALRDIAALRPPMHLLKSAFIQDLKERKTIVISASNDPSNPLDTNGRVASNGESKRSSTIADLSGGDKSSPNWLRKTDNYKIIARVRKDVDEVISKEVTAGTADTSLQSVSEKKERDTIWNEPIVVRPQDPAVGLALRLSSGTRYFTPDHIPIQRSTGDESSQVFIVGRSKELKWRIKAKRRGGASSRAVNRISRNHMRITTHRFGESGDLGVTITDLVGAHGITVNGVRLPAYKPKWLNVGDKVIIGSSKKDNQRVLEYTLEGGKRVRYKKSANGDTKEEMVEVEVEEIGETSEMDETKATDIFDGKKIAEDVTVILENRFESFGVEVTMDKERANQVCILDVQAIRLPKCNTLKPGMVLVEMNGEKMSTELRSDEVIKTELSVRPISARFVLFSSDVVEDVVEKKEGTKESGEVKKKSLRMATSNVDGEDGDGSGGEDVAEGTLEDDEDDMTPEEVAWSVWRPIMNDETSDDGMSSDLFFGDVLSLSNQEPKDSVLTTSDMLSKGVRLVRPVGFTLVTAVRKSPLDIDSDLLYMWLPTPPDENHVAVGCVVTVGPADLQPPQQPDDSVLARVRCVPLSSVVCVMPHDSAPALSFMDALDHLKERKKGKQKKGEGERKSSEASEKQKKITKQEMMDIDLAILQSKLVPFEKCLGCATVADPSPRSKPASKFVGSGKWGTSSLFFSFSLTFFFDIPLIFFFFFIFFPLLFFSKQVPQVSLISSFSEIQAEETAIIDQWTKCQSMSQTLICQTKALHQ